MSSKRKNSKKIKISRIFQRVLCCFITVIFMPGFFLIQMLMLKLSLFQKALWSYMFINLYGNQILSILTDTKVGSYEGKGEYCEVCKRNRPPRSWHCNICEVCILRRDHHCCILFHCVGLKNYRYFICFLAHCTLFISYTTIFFSYKLSHYSVADFYKLLEFMAPFFDPDHASILKRIQFYETNAVYLTLYLYVLCLAYDIVILAVTGPLFYKHIRNAFNGVTAYEAVLSKYPPKRHWKINIVRALGTRWHWALLCCFANSPLPEDIEPGGNRA